MDRGAPSPWLSVDPRAPEPSRCLWKVSPGTSGWSLRELYKQRQNCSSMLPSSLGNALESDFQTKNKQKQSQPVLCGSSYQIVWHFARYLAWIERSFLKDTTALRWGEWQSLAPVIDLHIKKNGLFFTFQLILPKIYFQHNRHDVAFAKQRIKILLSLLLRVTRSGSAGRDGWVEQII